MAGEGDAGLFTPPIAQTERWTYLDLRREPAPHVCADVQQLPFGSSTFDTLVCLEFLQYVPSLRAAFDEMFRVLRPDGCLILSAPQVHRPDARTDLWRFTSDGLLHLSASTGFEMTRLSQQGHTLGAMMHMLRAVNVRPVWLQRIINWTARPLRALVLALDRQSEHRCTGSHHRLRCRGRKRRAAQG